MSEVYSVLPLSILSTAFETSIWWGWVKDCGCCSRSPLYSQDPVLLFLYSDNHHTSSRCFYCALLFSSLLGLGKLSLCHFTHKALHTLHTRIRLEINSLTDCCDATDWQVAEISSTALCQNCWHQCDCHSVEMLVQLLRCGCHPTSIWMSSFAFLFACERVMPLAMPIIVNWPIMDYSLISNQ